MEHTRWLRFVFKFQAESFTLAKDRCETLIGRLAHQIQVMLSIICESLNRTLELNSFVSGLSLFLECRHDYRHAIEFVRVAVQTLVV